MKIKIEKNTVQETLIIPLYAKKVAMDLYPELFHDEECQRIFENIEYSYEYKLGVKEKIGAIMGATRQYNMVECMKKYLKDHPYASIVNLGCGLDTAFYQADNGKATSYCIDLSDVIDIRKKLLKEKDREKYIACDLNDFDKWSSQIEYDKKKGIMFFASGVFYYFFKDDVKKLISSMAEKYEGALLVFDATNRFGIKGMQKTWLNDADIDVGTYFYLEDAESEIKSWSSSIKDVIKKPYMSGYRPLQKEYGIIANLVFRVFDGMNSGQFVEVYF